ncbi:MAG: hypothetical protein ACP5JT_02475 [Thermoplasmata archaeon]
MIFSGINSKLPMALNYLINIISNGDLIFGIIIIIIAIIMLLFSRYFTQIFLLGYLILIFIFLGIMQNLGIKLQVIMIIAFLVFMPFLYFGFKYSFSITIVNIMMFGYALIFYKFFENVIFNPIFASIFIIIIFIFSIITFFLILKLKLKSIIIKEEV